MIFVALFESLNDFYAMGVFVEVELGVHPEEVRRARHA